jgi:hypothetical protein
MPPPRDPDPAAIPTNSLVLGYGPMLPFIAAAVGMWGLAGAWPAIALRLGVIWAAIILVFVAGVRRGFGFGAGRASTRVEIVTMLLYFVPAGAALVVSLFGWYPVALILLLLGFAMVTVLDTRAARHGDAPRHFARLRPPQMSLAMASLAAMLFRLVG